MSYIFFTEAELKNEIWKDIAGFEGRYQISNLGRVKSLVIYGKQQSPSIMKPNPHKQGYHLISLRMNGKSFYFYIHHLVLTAFVCERPKGLECNHKNTIKNDNRVDNLEWITPKKNIQHAIENGLRNLVGENNHKAKLTESDVIEIRKRLKNNEFQKTIAKDYGVSATTIGHISRNESWRHI